MIIYICEGDKTIASASNEACNVEYGNGAMYISKLQAFKASDNGLIIDNTEDKNIRYAGSINDVNNKVYFNCKDTDSAGVSYGETNYNYASSCEVWRIIGIFDVDNGKGNLEKRIKIVRDALPARMSFDSSANNNGTDNNSGSGINQWGPSIYEDGSTYEGADLMRMLNGYYIGKEDTCTYCNGKQQETCENDCTSSITPLSNTSIDMVEDALWKLGAQHWITDMPVTTMYNAERETQSGKICPSTIASSDGNYYCTDTVTRTSEWVVKIGLIYSSDYGYASSDTSCAADIAGDNSMCKNNNWLHPNNLYWTISPYASTNSAAGVRVVIPAYAVDDNGAAGVCSVRPSLYLASNIQIIGGNGNTEPYKLSL